MNSAWINQELRGLDRRTLNSAIIGLLILLGGAIQGYANGTIDALFVAVLLLFTGFAVIKIVFPDKRSEMRAFLLTYGACVFAGGLAQLYSLQVFDNSQSTIDSFTFLREISPQPPWTTMASLHPNINSRLAIVIWQQVYKMAYWLGLAFGPYTGIMFNAFVMGLTGSIAVATARKFFGDDLWRLHRVGTLFALCGLFILFGSVLIRDCFTTFFNALVLLWIIRWLIRPSFRNLLFAALLIGVSAYAMVFLRLQAVALFWLYVFLAFLCWLLSQKMNMARLIATFFAMCALLISSPYILNYVQTSEESRSEGMERYANKGRDTSSADSLGMRLVVNQPLPIRLVMGSGVMMISPIPLWANFKINSLDYDWIRGYHGFYQVITLPLIFAGLLAVLRMVRRDWKQAVPLLFLVAYLFMNIAAVVTTSQEQRHLGQFLTAFLILAALPDTRKTATRKELQRIAIWWFSVVLLIHLAWAIMKG